MIKVYVMKFTLDGRQIWLKESMDRDTAFAMGRRYGRLGRKPVIVRIDTSPKSLLACGNVSYRRRRSA